MSQKNQYTQCRTHLEFDVRLTADRNVAANVGIVTMLLQKLNVTNEDLAQPLENLGVVEDLVLDQLLRDWEQHLRTEQTHHYISQSIHHLWPTWHESKSISQVIWLLLMTTKDNITMYTSKISRNCHQNTAVSQHGYNLNMAVSQHGYNLHSTAHRTDTVLNLKLTTAWRTANGLLHAIRWHDTEVSKYEEFTQDA